MQLSIIIPVYNTEKYIEKCINSIIKSNVNNYDFEVICINDGSTDKSLRVLEKIKDNNSLQMKIINIENLGVSNARNIGINEAKGEYITFVDSDDWVNKDFLQNIFESFKKYIDIDMFIFNTEFVSDKSFVKKEKINDTVFNTENHACCKVFRKKLLLENDIFFPTDIKLGEDMVFTFKYMLNTKKIKHIDKVIYCYRINRNGSVMTTQVNSLYKEIFLACDNLYNYSIKKNIINKYKYEIEYLFIKNILIRNTPKIIKNNINIKNILQEINDELDYINNKFPKWQENIYLNNNSDSYCSEKLGIYFKKVLNAMNSRKYFKMIYYFVIGKLVREIRKND